MNPVVEDKRFGGVPIELAFQGALRLEQKAAAMELKKFDSGILAAGTAFGKTVVAAYMIAERKVNTLVLVNRRQLQLQWIARLAEFLGIPERLDASAEVRIDGREDWTWRFSSRFRARAWSIPA